MNAEYQRLDAEASDVERQMQELSKTINLDSASAHAAFERRMAQLGGKLASLRQGLALVRTASSLEMQKRESEFVKSLPQKCHSQGLRKNAVHLAYGVTVTLHITYYHRCKCPTVTARHGRRGLFPILMLLGISRRFTPRARKNMAQAAALLGSYEEAAQMLEEQGLEISVNQLREVTAGMGRMLKRLTNQGSLAAKGDLSGRRIVVSLDGGRVRLRERRRGKTKKGRKRFHAAWREPRLFIIYAVDDEGRMADDFPPVIDGCLGSCNELFAMLLAYLKGFNLTLAARLLIVADGATWIWNRVPGLLKALGLKNEQVQQLVDFWHAVQYLVKIAESTSLTGARQKQWVTTQKNRLLRGEIGSVVKELNTQIGSRKTKEQTTWLNYFITNGLTNRRMDYFQSRVHKMPIGSGAIESAIRRIINLRVKSNAVYWLRDNAETMIRLRSWIKAGRAEELFHYTTCVTPGLAL